MPDDLSPEEVAETLDVSRETLDQLKLYVEVLLKWRRRINLIGPGTVDIVWRRHILDCGQLIRHLPPTPAPLVDIGTGAGLPGLVLAILGVPDVHLIEADSRKCAFLREAARQTEAPVTVHETRAEADADFPARVVTARAVAPIERLLDLSGSYLTPETICFFLKGRGVRNELTGLKKKWKMRLETLPSLSGAAGAIVKMESVARVDVPDGRCP